MEQEIWEGEKKEQRQIFFVKFFSEGNLIN